MSLLPQKVKIEEFLVCPAVQHTSIPSLVIQRYIFFVLDIGQYAAWKVGSWLGQSHLLGAGQHSNRKYFVGWKFLQFSEVELAKRGWLWQAIDSACQNTSAKLLWAQLLSVYYTPTFSWNMIFSLELKTYNNGSEAQKGDLRNIFRRHRKLPVRIIPADRPQVWPNKFPIHLQINSPRAAAQRLQGNWGLTSSGEKQSENSGMSNWVYICLCES